jgi:hypothetical protein
MVRGGQTSPIGRGSRPHLQAEFDEAKRFRASAAIDPVRGLYVLRLPATDSSMAC